MIGLIYKDVICLKKNLKLFVAVGIGVLLLAVMFALSCKMGNIADGLKNYDATDTMGLELLITVIDIAMHMVLFIPVAFIGNIIDCFLADYKAGFNNSLRGLPCRCKIYSHDIIRHVRFGFCIGNGYWYKCGNRQNCF